MAVIKDVAKMAGVSTGTISKYFNNPEGLKESTRIKVEDAVNTLQYKPSPLARSMRTHKTNTLAVFVPDIVNPFFAEVYNSIRYSAMENGYTAILFTTEDDMDTLRNYLKGISIRQADGLVLCFLDEDEIMEKFIEEIEAEKPIVQLSWDFHNIRFKSVVIDVYEGICKSTAHLIDLGHKRIAYIGGPENSRISREKLNGYLNTLRKAGMEPDNELIHAGSYSLQWGYQAARSLVMLPQPPTALVAANDIIAIGCMKYFLQNKIRIPKDIAVIGFDNISLSAMYEPALSTIALPIEQLGTEAIRLFMQRSGRPQAKPRQVILKSQLIVRTSTDASMPVEFGE